MSFRNKPRRKRSPIWEIEKTKLELIVSNSSSIAEILRKLEIYTAGSNRNTLMRRLNNDNINVKHLSFGLDSNRGRKFGEYKHALPNDVVFIENSQTSRSVVRRKIIKKNLLPYVCSECNQPPLWKEKQLTLVLDHINGVPNDHRLENLRFLCPNCNSQTDTFCGRNIK